MTAVRLAAGYSRRARPLIDHEHEALPRISGRVVVSKTLGVSEHRLGILRKRTLTLDRRLVVWLTKEIHQPLIIVVGMLARSLCSENPANAMKSPAEPRPREKGHA